LELIGVGQRVITVNAFDVFETSRSVERRMKTAVTASPDQQIASRLTDDSRAVPLSDKGVAVELAGRQRM
jgi:hypothetical protein